MKLRNVFSFALIIIFFLMILSPFLGQLLGITSQADNNEYRRLAQFPQITLSTFSTFPKSFTTYFNDNFGFRNLMIEKLSFLKLNYLGASPDIGRIYGNHGWIYANPIQRIIFKEFYKNIEFTPDELFKITQKLIAEQEQLAHLNIPYILVLVPDKEVVYSEDYPYSPYVDTNYRLNQLTDYLKKNSKLDVLDLRESLISSKGGLPLWYRTDTHWNNYGAFIAYQQIMQKFSNYKLDLRWPLPSDFIIQPEYYDLWLGDLGPHFQWWQKQPDIGVKFALNLNRQFSKFNTVIVYGDSYSHAVRFARWQEILEQFPQIKLVLGLLFKNPQGDEDLQPLTKIEDLIPIIRKNVPREIQDRLIAYLINNRVLDEDLVGINYFLKFTFNKVIEADYHTPIDFDQVKSEKPQLVIREVVQRYLDNWVLLTK